MKTTILCFLAGILAAACPLWGQPPAGVKPAMARDLEQIQQLERMDAAAAKANDVEALTALWTDDGVLIPPMSEPVIGRAHIHSLLEQQKQQAAGVQMTLYEESWKERRIERDTAFEWGMITARLRLPDGKEVTQMVYAARFLVRSQSGAWRFARAIITPAPRPTATTAQAK